MSLALPNGLVHRADHGGNRFQVTVLTPWGWVFWGLFALAVVGSQFQVPASQNNVFQVYRDAGQRWLEGQPLYDGTGTGFIYLPHCAVLFVPFGLLPYYWGAALWRLLNVGVFAVGVWRFVRLAGRDRSPSMFPLVSLIVVLLSWSAGRYGQMTLTMGGLMLMAVVELVDRRWWRAALWMTLGVALKPLMIVLMLLAAVLYPRTSWRMLLAAIGLAALPLLAQRHVYVLEQYRQSIQMLGDANARGVTHQFAHLFWVLKSAGIDVPAAGQTALRLMAALATLTICWRAPRRCNAAQAGVLLYTLTVIYLLLFNPRTEHNMYCLLAPALGIFAAQAIAAHHRLAATIVIGMATAMLLSYPLGNVVPTMWLKPLVCILFLAIVLGPFQDVILSETKDLSGRGDSLLRAE